MDLRNWIGGRPVVYKWQGVRLIRSELRWNTCRSTAWKNSGLKRNKTWVLRKCKNDLRQNVRQMMQREKYTVDWNLQMAASALTKEKPQENAQRLKIHES